MSNPTSGSLQIRTEQNGDELHLFISGPLNEDSSFGSVSLIPNSSLHIHLDEISSINSTGIRQWLLWVRDHSEANWQLWGCPPHFINQLNMIDKFVPAAAKIRSFYVPFFSDETGEEVRLLIDRDEWDKNKDILQVPNDSNGHPMEPDIIEDRFYKFCSRY
jgi:hypothetical protein